MDEEEHCFICCDENVKRPLHKVCSCNTLCHIECHIRMLESISDPHKCPVCLNSFSHYYRMKLTWTGRTMAVLSTCMGLIMVTIMNTQEVCDHSWFGSGKCTCYQNRLIVECNKIVFYNMIFQSCKIVVTLCFFMKTFLLMKFVTSCPRTQCGRSTPS